VKFTIRISWLLALLVRSLLYWNTTIGRKIECVVFVEIVIHMIEIIVRFRALCINYTLMH